MKKIIITLGLWFLVTGLWAQNDKGAKVVPVSQAIQNNGFNIQVGLPYLGQNSNSVERIVNPVDVRFPWGILYLFETFAEGSFDVSKGYFGDKILINWELGANSSLVTSIKIYKREYTEMDTNTFEPLGSVPSDVTAYEDKYVEGGVLYEYKIVAEGVSSIEKLYNTYITGIGYRNPTAVVTGNVSFKGGNPVKDVIVKANSDGGSDNLGSSLQVPATGAVILQEVKNPITTVATLQAWVKPVAPYTDDSGTPINIFKLSGIEANTFDVTVNLLATSKILYVNIGESEYQLHNYFPSGKLNSRGDDVMVPVTDFNINFVHFSVVIDDGNVPKLYINGREISETYKNDINENLAGIDPNYTEPYFNVTIPTQTNSLNIGGANPVWGNINIGGSTASLIDEIRIWKAALESATIRTDYSRYLSGNDSRLVAYLRANEKIGSYAYDLSRNGFNYNRNHGELWDSSTIINDRVTWSFDTESYPTKEQLGILGVTDKNGNYEINSIPYSGTGESFTITPLYGQHQFEPAQQLVYLGQGSEVVNKIDFIDKSSFSFKGKVLYDTRGVFQSFVDVNSPESVPEFSGLTPGDEYILASKIIGEGYNYFETLSDGKKDKGEYWYNDNRTLNDSLDDYLERYAKVYSDQVNVYIDGNIVLDENSVPVVSDVNGYFDVSVPIGNHYISVKKTGHDFKYEGRFPSEGGTYKEFFEDSNEPVVFIDNTRVTLVGKVVGGSVEAAKPIGFGGDGLFQEQILDSNGNPKIIDISAKNNIGVAKIKLGYIPPGSTESEIETEFNFTTNIESGEYRVDVMPLKYQINQLNGLIINSNSSLSLLSSNENVDVSKVEALTTPEFELPNGESVFGAPYHYEKSFTYRSTPVLRVLNQTSESEIEINGNKISTEGFEFPIYEQFTPYTIKLQSFEPYVNKDSDIEIEDIVPIIDGEFKPTNNLALSEPEPLNIDIDANDNSIFTYTFKAGIPAISPPFTKTMTLQYIINNVAYEAENYIKEGIIIGGQSDGSQTFTTAAPDIPDIILRDPPGSNSYASIEKGESISFSVENEVTDSGGAKENLQIGGGVFIQAGGGLAGAVTTVETKNSADLSLSVTTSSKDGTSLSKTYNFNQTISTSDSPEFVGAEGDLYIGQSKNYYYGSYDDVQVKDTIARPLDSYPLTNDLGKTIYIKKQKGFYFTEEPSDTFFMLSQKYILETLIPELEVIIANYDLQSPAPPLEKSYYEQQINLWRKVILNNELTKYRALKERDVLKAEAIATIDKYIVDVNTAINETSVGALQQVLIDNLNEGEKLKELVSNRFVENISFDAGVGEFTKSAETVIVNNTSTTFNVTIEEGFQYVAGFEINKAGFTNTISGFLNQDKYASLSEEKTSTTNISYTLKDNDPANALSVDVINAFDGNGPIFSTIGGRTSCPYEGPELSYFYNHTDYDSDATQILPLDEASRTELSFGTQKAEDPQISVKVADVYNIPESNKAEYTLLLENRADATSDAAVFNYFELLIDNVTNPYNVVTNLSLGGTTGTVVYIPYGEVVPFTLTLEKSVSDVYDYEDIRVVLQSRCDPVYVYSDVIISAHFVPSCSQVNVKAPLNNWVYNNKTAFNADDTVNPLKVDLSGYNTSFNSFKKIDLEYRLATSPTWTRLQTYYTTQEFYDEAVAANESEIALIDATELSFQFDIVDLQLQDGNYELRAKSTCTNDTEYISEIITGRVDLTSPKRFGTPLPIDGILGAGEDLKVSFNESVFYNSSISTIEVKGQTNQLPINNNVSLYFQGSDNTAIIENPKITSGDITFEFWMNNNTTASSADIIKQDSGLNIGLSNGQIYFTLGGLTAEGAIINDGLYHHYTFTHKNSTGELSIYEDDKEIGSVTGNANITFTNNTPLVIGGNTFIGNMHSLRFWNKTISLVNAYAKMYDKLIGNEASLVGYWPMDEGRGAIAKDLARFKHAQVNTDWDIKPKGTSYEFTNGQYLALNDVGFVQLTNEMDATISFWMKTGVSQEATLFSNGKGDGTDVIQTNGFANKWAINTTNEGNLLFESEGNSYVLTNESVADNNWHHITLLFNRIGSLRTYVDGQPVSSNQMSEIGGFSGNKIWIGARGTIDLSGIETVDNVFTGKLDEFRLWNTLRNAEQISRDRFNEIDIESIGLQLYAKMNAPDPLNGNGTRYFHADANETITASLAELNSGGASYSNDVPAIKPERELIKFQVNYVVNDDQIILEPIVTDWASLEGQILDITVHRMFDSANNRQQSPITWTAYVKRNEVSWFVEGYNDIVDLIKNSGEEKTFEITLLNKGGKAQPFNINNLPNWLHLSTTTGTIPPDSSIVIKATVDEELSVGQYQSVLYLQTDLGYDEKMQLELRVFEEEPDWNINPSDFDYSMNIVGRLKVDNVFSTDKYDKIAAFTNGEVRGVSGLVYNEDYQEYYVYLTIYSNIISTENVVFNIWDASQGKILEATLDNESSIIFMDNKLSGTIAAPVIFENTQVISEEIKLNQGWTWVSLNVNDPNFSDFNTLTQAMILETDDRIISFSPAYIELYNLSSLEWTGNISKRDNGLHVDRMYKIKLAHEQSLFITGPAVDLTTWSFPIQTNWNWLPYPLSSNSLTNEALAAFSPNEGDVIKSQNLFAIYDPQSGWTGTLNYLESTKGYMLQSSSAQTLTYPSYLESTFNKSASVKNANNNYAVFETQVETPSAFKQYNANMNAVVKLPEGYDELFAYDGEGHLKGEAKNQLVQGKALSFITIYGETPELLMFYIGDGQRQKPTSKSINFKANDVLGTVAEPIVIEDFVGDINVFPNPFKSEVMVNIKTLKSQQAIFTIYSLTGQSLFTQNEWVDIGMNALKIFPNVSSGMYMLEVTLDESTTLLKLIKE